MRRDTLQTIAVVVAVFMSAWHISGTASANTAAIFTNTVTIAKLEGVLLTHIADHSHATKVVEESEEVE